MPRYLLLIVVLCIAVCRVSLGQTLLDVNFDEHTAGAYSLDQLESDFRNVTSFQGFSSDDSRVSISDSQLASLVVNCDGAGLISSGAHWTADLRNPAREAYLSYRIRFEDGFDFTRGVKLPGLIGGVTPEGATRANGENGWMTRMMMLPDNTGGANLVSIAKYHQSGSPNLPGGEDYRDCVGADGTKTAIQTNKWYRVLQRVRLNSIASLGNPDGILQVWLDGELVLDQTDVTYRTIAGLGIDKFNFSCFMNGGPTGPIRKQFTSIDDIKVTVPSSENIVVPDDYGSIAEAVSNSNPGDQIYVRPGTYPVSTVKITHPLTITGSKLTNVEGTFSGPAATQFEPAVFDICSANVDLNSLNIRNGNRGVKVEQNMVDVAVRRVVTNGTRSGLFVEPNCHRFKVVDCSMRGRNDYGIHITGSDDVLISWNTASSGPDAGCMLQNCDGASVMRNSFVGGSGGFSINDSTDVLFKSNLSDGSPAFGARFQRCQDCLILSNELLNTGQGFLRPFGTDLVLVDVDSMFVFDNIIEGGASTAFFAAGMTNSFVRDNDMYAPENFGLGSPSVVTICSSSGNRFSFNSVLASQYGICFFDGSMNNTVTMNEFEFFGSESSNGTVMDSSDSETLVIDNTVVD